jgi:hypothetical protein
MTKSVGSKQWQNGQDFCPDTLYLLSEPISAESKADLVHQATA